MLRRSRRLTVPTSLLSIASFLVTFVPLACSSSSGHVDTPKPAASISASVAAAEPPRDPCDIAADLRAKVKPFLDEGRLERTVKLIQKADRLCPTSAPETWAALVTTLAELGKYKEARDVAKQIEAGTNVSDEAKAAAKLAKETCDKLDKTFPPVGVDKEMMKIEYLQAMLAEARSDPDSQKLAKEKYLAAWEAWRPNAQALALAGFAARKLGQSAEALRLFDRAIVDAEKAQGKDVTLEVPNGFSGRVNAVAWSKDGRRFAVANGNEISIFDSTWRQKFRLGGHGQRVTSIAFSPDGWKIASGSDDKSIKLWDIGRGNEIRTLQGHTDAVNGVAYSPDGGMLASRSLDHTIKVWDVYAGNEIRTIEGQNVDVTAALRFPNSKTLASVNTNMTSRLWDIATGKRLPSHDGGPGMMRSIAYAPNGETFAAGSTDGIVREWNVATGKLVRELSGHKGAVTSIEYAPDGKNLAAASQDAVRLWDLATGKTLGELQETGDFVTSLVYSPDGKTLAVGVNYYSVFHKVRLWDVATRTIARTLEEHSSYHTAIKYAPNAETLAAGYADGTVRLWDVANGSFSRTFYGHTDGVRSIDYSFNGQILASASDDKTLRVWDVERGRLRDKLEGHTGPVASVVASPDGKTLASYSNSGADHVIRLWDIAKGKLAFQLEGHRDLIFAIAYSPDSKTLVSACRDQKVRLWSVTDGKLLHLLEGHRDVVMSVAYAPDGKTLASADTAGVIRLWETATGKPLRSFDAPLSAHAGDWFASIKSIAYSTDGKTIASRTDGKSYKWGSDDLTLVWDIDTGKRLRTMEGHENEVFWGARSPFGPMVALDQDDTSSILLQDVNNESKFATLRVIPTHDASYVYVPSGHIEIFGADACVTRAYPVCRVGNLTFPFDVCEERFYAPGLLTKVHANSTSYLEPENAPRLMKCPEALP